MSKNIPKPIVRIGHSIKKNGTITSEIDGNKIKNMSVNQFTDLITELTKVRRKLVSMRGSASFDGVLTADQYDEIETMLKDEQGAQTYYKKIGILAIICLIMTIIALIASLLKYLKII